MERALFGIGAEHPREVFIGWHNPRIRWNGWATPGFDRSEVERIIAWVTAAEAGNDPQWRAVFAWEGDVLTYRGQDSEDVEELRPDTHGRYGLGAFSWTWDEREDLSAISNVLLAEGSEDRDVAYSAAWDRARDVLGEGLGNLTAWGERGRYTAEEFTRMAGDPYTVWALAEYVATDDPRPFDVIMADLAS